MHSLPQNRGKLGAQQDEPQQPLNPLRPQPPPACSLRAGGVPSKHGRRRCSHACQRPHVLSRLSRGDSGRGPGRHLPSLHCLDRPGEKEGQSEEADLDRGGGRRETVEDVAEKFRENPTDLNHHITIQRLVCVLCVCACCVCVSLSSLQLQYFIYHNISVYTYTFRSVCVCVVCVIVIVYYIPFMW